MSSGKEKPSLVCTHCSLPSDVLFIHARKERIKNCDPLLSRVRKHAFTPALNWNISQRRDKVCCSLIGRAALKEGALLKVYFWAFIYYSDLLREAWGRILSVCLSVCLFLFFFHSEKYAHKYYIRCNWSTVFSHANTHKQGVHPRVHYVNDCDVTLEKFIILQLKLH